MKGKAVTITSTQIDHRDLVAGAFDYLGIEEVARRAAQNLV
jgi:hypothetical protein